MSDAKEEKSKRTVVAFLWVTTNIRGVKRELLENRTQYQDIRDAVVDELESVSDNLITDIVAQRKVTDSDLLSQETLFELKRKVLKLKRAGNPPFCTHDLHNEESDAILNACRAAGLSNAAEDMVKVVFYPIYLTGADGLLDLNYYESPARRRKRQGKHSSLQPKL